jgi:probable phosphoglycerate mutase
MQNAHQTTWATSLDIVILRVTTYCQQITTMKTLSCMRHGQTNYNVLGLCNDDPKREVSLTKLGFQQATAAAAQLQHADIERIFVSPLPRTQQTAEIINEYHSVPIIVHPLLTDIRSGFDGRPVAEYFAAIAHDKLHACVNGGESLWQHRTRVLQFIDWLLREPYQRVLVVAHEETLRVFIAHFHHIDPQSMLQLSIGNCEIVSFDIET